MNIAVVFPVLAILAGAMTAYQPLINAKLSQHLDSPIWASFISFLVGALFLLIIGFAINGKFMVDVYRWNFGGFLCDGSNLYRAVSGCCCHGRVVYCRAAANGWPIGSFWHFI